MLICYEWKCVYVSSNESKHCLDYKKTQLHIILLPETTCHCFKETEKHYKMGSEGQMQVT